MLTLSKALFCRGIFAAVLTAVPALPASAQLFFGAPADTTLPITTQITGNTEVILESEDTGTVAFSGGGPATGNTYSGDTHIVGGTLQAIMGSGTGNAFSPNSTVFLDSRTTLDLNGNTETIAALESPAPDSVVTNSGNGSARLIIDDSQAALNSDQFNGTITDTPGNSLAITKAGPGQEIFLGDNTYRGGTTISGGTLIVGGSSLGTGSVGNSATLESISMIGGGVETIGVGANYTQSAGGTLRLLVASTPAGFPPVNSGTAGGNYDTLHSAGSSTLAGTLVMDFGGGSAPSQGQRFIALTAGTALASEFRTTTLTNAGAAFLPLTTYNDTYGGLGGSEPANAVVVALVRPFTSFAGLTPNELNVAQNIDLNVIALNNSPLALSPKGNVLDFINNIVPGLSLASYTPGALAAALNQLSPQRDEILRNIAFDNFALDTQALDNVFARERYGPGGLDTTGFVLNDRAMGTSLSQIRGRLMAWNPPVETGLLSDSGIQLGGVRMVDPKDMKQMSAPAAPGKKWNAFIEGGADFGDLRHNIDTSHSSYTTGRVRAGADYEVAPNTRFGAMFGYSRTDADLATAGDSATVDSYLPGIYFTYASPKGFYANAVATGGINDYETDRTLNFPGVNRTAHGSTSGVQLGGDVDGGYEFHKGNWTFGPSAGLTYVNLSIDGLNESGAGAANLTIGHQSNESLRSRVGATVRYQGRIGSVLLTPHLSAYWQHEFLDGATTVTDQFEGLPIGTFSVQEPAGDRDNALVDAGLDAVICGNITLFLDYTTEAGGSDFFGQSATGGVKIAF